MSNYTKITNFAAKDSGTLDATRLITGTAHDNEFNAISTAIATKADLTSPTLVTPNIGAATGTAPLVVASTTEVTNLHAATATLATLATTATDTASKTGTGSTYVTNTSPTLITPALGTPTSGNLANLTLKSASPTIGVGYSSGAGGSVTQLSSKSTGVTLNNVCGRIITSNENLVAGTAVSFVFTNSTISITDTITSSFSSSNAITNYAYLITFADIANGSCVVVIRNLDGSNHAEVLAINYTIHKSVTA